MALIRFKPHENLRTMGDLQEEINKLFDFSFGRQEAASFERLIAPIDLWEDKDNVYVETDLPGLEQKDISVMVKDGNLVISGKREEKNEEKKKNYYRSERLMGQFFREVSLTSSVQTQNIKASYKNGVLKVILPKREEAKEKEVKINVE